MTEHALPTSASAISCPLCGDDASGVLAPELRRGAGEVYYCDKCDHGFLAECLVGDPKAYYKGTYRQEYSHHAEVAATSARELFDVYRQFQSHRLADILPVLGPESRLLEVGASAGQFLVHVKDKVAIVNAIELDSACCEFLRQEHCIEAESDYLENTRFANEQYDVVCAFQVMEHVEDPVAFLQTLNKATRPGGAIFVEVPNLRDPLLSVWDVPTYRKFFYHSAHLHYFTEASLRQVAQRAGFAEKSMEIGFTQDYNLLNHLHWIMNDGPQANCLVGLSDICFTGADPEMAGWLGREMADLHKRYVERLVASKRTSNMILKLRNE